MIFLIFLEIILAVFGAWCILNEETLIAFEDAITANVKNRIARKKRDR